MNVPEQQKVIRFLSFVFKAYVVVTSVAYSWWIYNLVGSTEGASESFAVKQTFNTLLIGYNVSIFGLVTLGLFQFVRKRKKEAGWNLLFVGYALVWILFLAPVNVK